MARLGRFSRVGDRLRSIESWSKVDRAVRFKCLTPGNHSPAVHSRHFGWWRKPT